jgi:hypothetical protein
MLSTPTTQQARQQEWVTICSIARNNGFPLQFIHILKNKIIGTQKTENTPTQIQRKKWVTFKYHSLLIHKVTNLFKCTNISTAFRTCNTIYNQLQDRTPRDKSNYIVICGLQCRTWNKSYVGQTGRTIAIRHYEHIHYIKTNNPVSAYVLLILNNRQEYGSPKHTMQVLQTCDKGKMMNCWESFYIAHTTATRLIDW